LKDLGFAKSEFSVSLETLDLPAAHGFETVEFLFAPNPGEPSHPLRAIASSGEISRVMLALKSALADQDDVPVLIFDEIDANVGGEIAAKVGQKMRELGQSRQVLCITHLPQVAAAASSQFVVTKEVKDARTRTSLDETKGISREEEIARMLGGKTDSALAHARTLLNK
ncbi:MAG: DNA repair protein RecN, partial [Verrucomicrobiota bacterium]